MKFKNKTKLISFITASSLPLVVGSAVVFTSNKDILNKTFLVFLETLKLMKVLLVKTMINKMKMQLTKNLLIH